MYVIGTILLLAQLELHPLKISTCLITYDQTLQALKFDFYFFADDFSAHLSRINHKEVSFTSDIEESNDLINKYIIDNIDIVHNNQPLVLEFESSTLEENVEHVQYSVSNFSLDKNDNVFKITNKLLLDAFDEQSNILRMDLKGDKNFRSFRFKKDEFEAEYILTN